MRRASWISLAILCLAAPAVAADDWAKLLFETTAHNFGTVARGAVADYRFKIENPYVEDVTIESVQSSCGCTKPSFTKARLKTYQTGEIVATLDTRSYGQKEATIYVKFSEPFPTTFELKVSVNIRGDVVFEPGAVQFGSVSQGQSDRKRVSVMYAGRPTWRVREVSTESPYLGLEIFEAGIATDPKTKASQVTYDLWVTLKASAPAGYLKDEVTIFTNDPNPQAAKIPLVVEGLVLPSLSAYPSHWQLGVLSSGQITTKPLVVRDRKPFKIVEVTGPDSQFTFTLPPGAKETQVIAAQFQAANRPGKVSGKIRITTDSPGAKALEIPVDGTVIASGASAATPDGAP